VLVSQQFAAKQTSELTVVQNLSGVALEGVVYLRCIALSKKTAQLIVDGGNDYLVTVKRINRDCWHSLKL